MLVGSVTKTLQSAASYVSSYVHSHSAMTAPVSSSSLPAQDSITSDGFSGYSQQRVNQPASCSGRVNPFDLDGSELLIDDHHFDQLPDGATSSASNMQGASDSFSSLSSKYSDNSRLLTELNISEDHFSKPDAALLNLSSPDSLQAAISNCKLRILELSRDLSMLQLDAGADAGHTITDSDATRRRLLAERRSRLVRLLVALRLRLHEQMALNTKEAASKFQHILGHQFVEGSAIESRNVASLYTAPANSTGAAYLLGLPADSLPSADVLQSLALAESSQDGDGKSRRSQAQRVQCDCCTKPVWTLMQDWYVCVLCAFRAHSRCLNMITRRCVALRISKLTGNEKVNPVLPPEDSSMQSDICSFELKVCPERGLLTQQFRCAECHIDLSSRFDQTVPILVSSDFVGAERRSHNGQSAFLTSLSATFRDDESEIETHASATGVIDEAQFVVRQCDYNGCYYCSVCHWNNVAIIPARVIHNWDFQPRPVCRASLQLLVLLHNRAVIDLDKLNPKLLESIASLSKVRRLREMILEMKRYFLRCRNALDSGILLLLSARQHFVENVNVYSLRDLVDLHNGILDRELRDVIDRFEKHIRYDCELCQAKAFICEICGNEADPLFLFDDMEMKVSVCNTCTTIYHKGCFERSSRHCRKCERLQRRKKA